MEPGQERRKHIRELREEVAEVFELRQKLRKRQLRRLLEEVEEIEHSLRRRNELADKIIERRIRDLLGRDEDEVLEW